MASQQDRPRPAAWGYPQAVALVAGLFAVSLLPGAAGVAVPAPPRLPASAFLLAALFFGTGVLQRLSPPGGIVAWLGGIRAGVASIAWLTGMTLVAALVPQDGGPGGSPGWHHRVVGSWPFTLAVLLMLVSLGLAIWRRARSLSVRNLGWLANHLGLWLLAGAMAAGSSDVITLIIVAKEGKAVNEAFLPGDEDMTRPVPLPFSLVLDDFVMESHPPRLVIREHPSRRRKHTETIAGGAEGKWGKWRWTVSRFHPSARPRGGGFEADPAGKGAFAALLAFAREDGTKAGGWLAAGSAGRPPRTVPLEAGLIAGAEAAPRLFRSKVTLELPEGGRIQGDIEVNRPLGFLGWKFYQSSYDESAGSHSRISVIEAIRDPWLPVVWCGMALLVAGAAWLFLAGAGTRGSRR